MQLHQIILFSFLADENDPTPTNYVVLKDTDCLGYDVYNNRPRPAPTLNACIEQCLGFIYVYETISPFSSISPYHIDHMILS